LKILASIYRADQGTIKIGGTLAPFIELGVGFNQELGARENNEINGVLMGLSRREARARLDAVLDFAELREFEELKLKNYSSGMMVRLAFAIMVQAQADIMLIDEVLAVGDAAFAAKCMDVFHERKRNGQTVVLVTHDMATVQSLCDRAILLDHGELKHDGDAEEAAREYYRVNFRAVATEHAAANAGVEGAVVPNINMRLEEARLLSPSGAVIDNVEQGEPLAFDCLFEARRALPNPEITFHVMNDDQVIVFTVPGTVTGGALALGDNVRMRGTIENRLLTGRYTLDCWIRDDAGATRELNVQVIRLADFRVYGTEVRQGLISVESEIKVSREP
jgi:ABC-type polysaccharide/polyol phosphate transport system ATPase subunit